MNGQAPADLPTQNSISESILHPLAQLPVPESKLHFPLNLAYFRDSWVRHPRPTGAPQFTYACGLHKALGRLGIDRLRHCVRLLA